MIRIEKKARQHQIFDISLEIKKSLICYCYYLLHYYYYYYYYYYYDIYTHTFLAFPLTLSLPSSFTTRAYTTKNKLNY